MASKRRLRRNACLNKSQHATEANAKIAIRVTRQFDCRPYKCPYCSKWHIGHESTKRRNARLYYREKDQWLTK